MIENESKVNINNCFVYYFCISIGKTAHALSLRCNWRWRYIYRYIHRLITHRYVVKTIVLYNDEYNL